MIINRVELDTMTSAVLAMEEMIVTLPGSNSVLEDTVGDIKDILLRAYKRENKKRTVQGCNHVPIDKRLKVR